MTTFTDKEIKECSVSDLYHKTKLSEEVMGDVLKVGEKTIDVFIENQTVLQDEDEKEGDIYKLKEAYDNIVDLLKEYCDLKEEYYNIVALWIIGTYFHKLFPTYPYLYLNAMRGSGKSRTMKLVTTLSYEGQMLNSLTEAVLFRTKGCLGIDEFEGMERKGGEALRELLNSGYKKGTTVKRMRKKKTMEGEELVVEEFDVYRPIVMANINGIENVLEDRCIPLILEKSNNSQITNLIEIFDTDKRTLKTKEILSSLVKSNTFGVVSVDVVSLENLYKEWNNYVKEEYNNYTNNTNNTNYINYINYTQLFEMLKFSRIGGRDLEISFPIIIISSLLGGVVLKETTPTLQKLMSDKREDNMTENRDIMLMDFVSQIPENSGFRNINSLNDEFKQFVGSNDIEINSKWLGRALKRLSLVVDKRRVNTGVQVHLNIQKAMDKIKMFRK